MVRFNQNKMRQDTKLKKGLEMSILNRSWFVVLLLGSLIACIPESAGDSTPTPARSHAPITPVKHSLMDVKTTAIQVKGTSQTVPVSLVQLPSFSTVFPTDRFAPIQEDASSPNKDAVAFYWKNPDGTLNKSVIFALELDKNVSFREMRKKLMSRDWEWQISFKDGTRRVEQSSYIFYAKRAYSAWLRDVVRLENNKEPRNAAELKEDGAITYYLGEVEGRAFVVTLMYARMEEEELMPRVDVILKNLKFESKKQSQGS